jgi:peptidoglycan/xylan/chitin deacetylase (PgdA/CDA1 family)
MQPPPVRAVGVMVALLLLPACADQSSGPVSSGLPSRPAAASPEPSPTAGASQTARPSDQPGSAATYTVVRGDTLFAIATSHDTSVEQLQAWNAERYPSLATNPNGLEAGWELIVRGDPSVTPQPTPALTPRPSAQATPPQVAGCRAGNRVAAGAQETFYTVPNASHAVALTFDMGGRLDPALAIMSLLVDNGVCATLFPTGAMSQTATGQQVLAVVRAHPELFEIGNHTMHHCDLVSGGGGSPSTAPCAGGPPTADFIRRELTDAAAILRAGTGQNPQPYWRPPYGSVNQAVLDAAASVGYTKTFMWDIDTIDWKPIADGGPTAEQIASKVITQSQDGSNVLMHIGGYETLDALRIMVPGLRERGFSLTSLSDLLN